jgi:hypothetical protein
MLDHRITRALATLVVAGALVSCAADAEPPASGKREGQGKAAHQKRADRKSGLQHGAARPGHAHAAKQRGNGGSAGTGTASGEVSATGPAGAAQGNAAAPAQPGSKPSCTDDTSGDMDSSGSAPSYADLSDGCVRANGSQLRLAATSVGMVPTRMPDQNTQLSYGFELTPPSGSTLYVHAQAGPSGWATYLSRGHGEREIGRPTIDGGRVVLTLPVAELRGAPRLQWTLESSWLRSGVLGTSYAFDTAPNGGAASFHR